MNECMFCGEPCRGNVCEDCFDEIEDLAPREVIDKLTYSVASRTERPERPIVEDLEEE